MKIDKAIVKSFPIAIFFTSALLILYFISTIAFFKQSILFLLFILYCYPLLLICIHVKRAWWLLVEFFVFLFILFFNLLFFKPLRDNLPPSMIGRSDVVGYAQYYGYPFYLDTVIFFILIFHPIILFALLKIFEQYKRRKLQL